MMKILENQKEIVWKFGGQVTIEVKRLM
uniref:Uncharacterized protein n=1 Tax=Rhizophora mucronata TaxID=61149 RepID=A0A2P2PG62_RHIMU